MKHKHRWRKAWSPMGNGSRTYTRPCLGCKKIDWKDLDYTDLESVQLPKGGFRLVTVPGKALGEIMAAFNYIQQALWFAAIEIAARDGDEFYCEWSDMLLEGP